MLLELKRTYKKPLYTIGHLYIDGDYFCDTLEDAEREIKVPNETCIPSGYYRIIMNYSNRFKRIMPLIEDVPAFTGIRIHPGNDQNNTSGCILVGANTIRGKLTNSAEIFRRLSKYFFTAKEDIFISIN